jgi:hypothetical protein
VDERCSSSGPPCGTVTFATAGDHQFRLGAAGKNEQSRAYIISADAFLLE